ncbi:TetR/AcrR family transcriptional regulator [Rhodococcus sp. NPDC003318]|uniref:TetR/AcrR family transcriptional regulator n=1 Tax=Rhodococcus sp. NPDC003318 TaxID=3364503 RepID=UPI0036BA0596
MQTAGDEGIPPSVRRAWGLDAPGTRGPRRGLSLDQILDSAIELADDDGVAALSMARVAKKLGFTTMSLYRYVDSKDELIDLISDRALGAPPSLAPDLPWREGLSAWAIAEYAAVMRHTWWLQLPIVAPPTGPNNMRWLDAGLGTLAAVALPAVLKVRIILSTSLFVIGRARFSNDIAVAAAVDDDYATLLPALLDRERFPHLVAALSAGGFGDGDGDEDWAEHDFRFALNLLLDGVEKLIGERS